MSDTPVPVPVPVRLNSLPRTDAKSAGRIADELGRGGISALARHLDVSAQYVSTLIASAKDAPAGTERSAAA
ncbi:hypothetical protein EDE04_7334 [Streptomyces sp. 2132.2]|uniref:hypothetical protein n=1 Tax=Streptomyces sp. 2132.2 TaxID=2485161 RepID=UPI000FA9C258|nr:hypothetical protein [Streptomyces sp. 2132.2]ROQ88942.1 hypothetical protein EDE04_7334 [Streptomyces sp. 2132.2]